MTREDVEPATGMIKPVLPAWGVGEVQPPLAGVSATSFNSLRHARLRYERAQPVHATNDGTLGSLDGRGNLLVVIAQRFAWRSK